jgi:hypothetical protein
VGRDRLRERSPNRAGGRRAESANLAGEGGGRGRRQDDRRAPRRFIVKNADAAAIVAADDTRDATAEIAAVDRREISGVKTGLLIAGLAALTFWVVLVHALLSSP